MQRGYYDDLNLEDLKERNSSVTAWIESAEIKETQEEIFSRSEKDKELLPGVWTQAYRFAAFYVDNPSNIHRYNVLNKFRGNFSNLLSNTKSANEIPDLRSRNHFLQWVCKKHNEFLEVKNAKERIECDGNALFQNFGPNYKGIQDFLGEHDFYI
jgi:hypothetical protein